MPELACYFNTINNQLAKYALIDFLFSRLCAVNIVDKCGYRMYDNIGHIYREGGLDAFYILNNNCCGNCFHFALYGDELSTDKNEKHPQKVIIFYSVMYLFYWISTQF